MPDATKTITWERRWNSAPSPELQNGDIIETLRAKFFGQKEKAARCYTCRESNATMKKVGTPEFEIYKTRFPEVLPCGCNYEDAMLEMWAVQKGLFANDPSVSDIIPEGKKATSLRPENSWQGSSSRSRNVGNDLRRIHLGEASECRKC